MQIIPETYSEDVQDVFWTSYVRSIYVLCLRGMNELLWDNRLYILAVNYFCKNFHIDTWQGPKYASD